MPTSDSQRPTVLIAGAGIGGLTLGALLQKAGVPYAIFERSSVSNPIGSAIGLGAAVMPMFKQLGIYEELVAEGIPRENYWRRFAFVTTILSRPALHKLLMSQIPQEKIFYGKKLLSFKPTDHGVMLSLFRQFFRGGDDPRGCRWGQQCGRQNMYKEMEKQKPGSVPASDKLPLKYSSIALVGQTGQLDPEKYSMLQSSGCLYECVRADNRPYFSVAFPTKQNTICCMVVQFLDKKSRKLHDSFRTSEWGLETADEMASRPEVREAKFPGLDSASMGDLIDLTLKELMSKVMLEEKVFKTWAHERAVLIGDGLLKITLTQLHTFLASSSAAQKMTPAAGQGAVNAMMDALILSNYLETLRGNNMQEIQSVYNAYKKERYARAKGAVDASATTALATKNGLLGDMARYVVFNPPQWLWNAVMVKAGEYRPQAAFLRPFEDKGTVRPVYQPSLHLAGSIRVGQEGEPMDV